MNRKPGRRGSILKSTVTNGDETGDIPRLDEVTGPLRSKRVSFSAKNHIKEFTKDVSTSSEMESSDPTMDMTMIGDHGDGSPKEISMNFTGAVGPNTTFVVNQVDAELKVVPTNNPNTTFVVESYMEETNGNEVVKSEGDDETYGNRVVKSEGDDETYGNGVVASEVDDVTSPVLAGAGLAQGAFAQSSVKTEDLNMTTFSPQDMSLSMVMSPNSVLVEDREHDMSMTVYAPNATMDASPAGADMSLTFHNTRSSLRRSAMKNRHEKQLARIAEISEQDNTASIWTATALDVEQPTASNQTAGRYDMSMTVNHTDAAVETYDVSGMDLTNVGSYPQVEVARQLSDMSVLQRSVGRNNSQRISRKSDGCFEMSYTVLRDDHDQMNSPHGENELGMSMTMAWNERTAPNDLVADESQMSIVAGDSIYTTSSHVKSNAEQNTTRSNGISCDMSMTTYHSSSFDGGITRHPSDSTRANDMSMTFAEPRASSEIPNEQPSQHDGGSQVNRRRSRVSSKVNDSPKVRRNEETEEDKISNEGTRQLRPRSVLNGVSMVVKDHEGLSKPESTPVSTDELPAKSKTTGPGRKKPVPLPRNSAFGRFGLAKTPRRRLPESTMDKKLARRSSFKDREAEEQKQDLGAIEGTDEKLVDTPTKRRHSNKRLSTKKTEELTQPARVRPSGSNSDQVERPNTLDKSTESPRKKMSKSNALSVQSPRRSQMPCDVASPRRSSRNLPATSTVASTSSGFESAKSCGSEPKPAPRRVKKPPSDLFVTEVPQPTLRTLVPEVKSVEANVPKPSQLTTRTEEKCFAPMPSEMLTTRTEERHCSPKPSEMLTTRKEEEECVAGARLPMKHPDSKINPTQSLETSPHRSPGKRASVAPMNDQKTDLKETSSSHEAVTSPVRHSIAKQRRVLSPKVAIVAYPEAETEVRASQQLDKTTGLGFGFASPALSIDGKENTSVYRADASKMEMSRVTLDMASVLEDHHVKPSEVSMFDRTSVEPIVRVEAINDDEPEQERGLQDISMAFQESNMQMDESAINPSNLSLEALRHAAEPAAQASSQLSSRPEETEQVAVLESPVVDDSEQSTVIDEDEDEVEEGSVLGWLSGKGITTNPQPREDVDETSPFFDTTTVESTPTGPVNAVQVSKPKTTSNVLPKSSQPVNISFLKQLVPSTSRSNFSLMEPRSRRQTRGGLGALGTTTILGSTFVGQPVAPSEHMLKKLAQVKSLVGFQKVKLLDDIFLEARNLSDECFAYVIRDLTGSVEIPVLDAAEKERKLLKLTAQPYNPTNKLDPMLLFSKAKMNLMNGIIAQAQSGRQDT